MWNIAAGRNFAVLVSPYSSAPTYKLAFSSSLFVISFVVSASSRAISIRSQIVRTVYRFVYRSFIVSLFVSFIRFVTLHSANHWPSFIPSHGSRPETRQNKVFVQQLPFEKEKVQPQVPLFFLYKAGN